MTELVRGGAARAARREETTSRPPPSLPLSRLFIIRRGIITGCDQFFIMRRARAAALGLPSDCLRPVLPPPWRLRADVVEPDLEGYPALLDQRVVLDSNLERRVIARDHPHLDAYLREGEARRLPAHATIQLRSPWYSQEPREPPLFFCAARRTTLRGDSAALFRFILNRSAAIASRSYLLLYPRGRLKRALRVKPHLVEAVHQALRALPTESLQEARSSGGLVHEVHAIGLGRIEGASIAKAAGLRALGREGASMMGTNV